MAIALRSSLAWRMGLLALAAFPSLALGQVVLISPESGVQVVAADPGESGTLKLRARNESKVPITSAMFEGVAFGALTADALTIRPADESGRCKASSAMEKGELRFNLFVVGLAPSETVDCAYTVTRPASTLADVRIEWQQNDPANRDYIEVYVGSPAHVSFDVAPLTYAREGGEHVGTLRITASNAGRLDIEDLVIGACVAKAEVTPFEITSAAECAAPDALPTEDCPPDFRYLAVPIGDVPAGGSHACTVTMRTPTSTSLPLSVGVAPLGVYLTKSGQIVQERDLIPDTEVIQLTLMPLD